MRKFSKSLLALVLVAVMAVSLIASATAAVVRDDSGNISYTPLEQGVYSNATWHQYHLNVQTTLNGMVKDGKLPADTDTKEMAAEIVRSVFGVGTFDETYSSGWDPVIIAVNKTTFEAKVVFRESDIRKDYPNIFVGYPGLPGFNGLAGYRMVCRFNDKLYFVSMGQPTATLVEVDPYTNEAQIAYYTLLPAACMV